MKWLRLKSIPATFALLVLSAGCGTTRLSALVRSPSSDVPPIVARKTSNRDSPPRVIHAPQPAPTDAAIVTPAHHQAKPNPQKEALSVDALVEDVLARNPSLAQMTAAWQATSARYPQVRSWDDPILSGMIAPSSFGSNAVEGGYRVELSQKIPFPGKLRLRGQGALAEASAAGNDVEDMRVQLIESTRLAFYEYYLAARAIAVNEESLVLLKQFRENADVRYKNGQVPQQDILQADVEIGRQQERGLTLERMRKVSIARMNTLRNLPPDHPVPAPPDQLKVTQGLPDVEHLRSVAIARRPDLKALEDRIAVEKTSLALAFKDFYPDVEVAAAYDTIMGNGPARDLAPQIGVRMNLPIRVGRRNGAVAEAHAKIAQKHAELASRLNQVQFQVQEAYEQLLESERILALYEKTIMPAASKNVKAAQDAYVAATGKMPFPFLSLIEAQRNLVNLRDRNYEATADYFRRLATLERVIGGPIPATGEALRSVPKK
jgi:cobalt-zinc-cadmium efflux system outer membrane protein